MQSREGTSEDTRNNVFVIFKEITDRFKQLNIQFDQDGILRCYGRIQNAPLPSDTVNPILLDSKNSLAKLIEYYFTPHRVNILSWNKHSQK